MDRLLELCCDVDDFCKVVLPIWQNRLLTSGAMQRQRKRSLSISEIMTILSLFSPVAFSSLQGVLSRACLETSAQRVSRLGQLYPFCGVDSFCLGAVVCLPAHGLPGKMDRHRLHRFNRAGGLQQPKNPFPQGLCRAGGTGQDGYGLVFWLQTPPGLQ